MTTNELQRLWEEGGGREALLGAPLLQPFETPPPEQEWLETRPLSRQERADLEESARLLREAGPSIAERFRLSPWLIFQMLRRSSQERKVSPLLLTQRLLAAMDLGR